MATAPAVIEPPQLRAHLTGLGYLLDAWAEMSGESEDALVRRAAFIAEGKLRRQTGVPYFETRFCTAELASQETLVQASRSVDGDYDELLEARDYNLVNWRVNTGRLKVQWSPIRSVTLLRLTLANDGKILDVPNDWINVKEWQGLLNVIPYGSSQINYTTYYSLVGVLAVNRAALVAGVVPSMVHLRYTGGLVPRSGYDPADPGNGAAYPEWEILQYQEAICKQAAADVMRQVAREGDQGGYSAGFDGLSLSFNAQTLEQSAVAREKEAREWATRYRFQHRGPAMG